MQKFTCKLNMNQYKYQGFFPLFFSLKSDKSFLEIMQVSMLSATMGDQHTLKSTPFHIVQLYRYTSSFTLEDCPV